MNRNYANSAWSEIFKNAAHILNETGEQMMNRTTETEKYEESKVVDNKKYTWKDIVRINDVLYCEEFPISGDMDDSDTYRIDDFMYAVAEKYGCGTDDIKTYMLDDIEFDGKELIFGAEACGCYIDGVAEWLIDVRT